MTERTDAYLRYLQASTRILTHKTPHQVWFENAPTSPMLPDYESARQWAIKHDQAHVEGKWLVREPGVAILSEHEALVATGEQGLEDI